MDLHNFFLGEDKLKWLRTHISKRYFCNDPKGYEEGVYDLQIPSFIQASDQYCRDDLFCNQRLARACIVHLVIKRTNWSYGKTMSCSGSHLGIPINIKNTKFVKDLQIIDAQNISVFSHMVLC